MPPAVARRSRRARRLWILPLILIVLALAAYFGLSSQAFLKAVVLPRVGAAMNARLQAGEISLSPFSRLHLKQVRVETTGDQPLLTAEEATVRYRLFSLLGGTIAIPEITLVNPVLNVIVAADGRSNLDPLLSGEPEPTPAGQELPELDLGTVAIRSGTLSYCQFDPAGNRDCTTLTNLDLVLSNLRTDSPAKLTLSANALQTKSGAAGVLDAARGKLAGAFDFTLRRDLIPTGLKGDLRLEFTEASGALRELADWSAALGVDLTPEQLRQLSVKFQRGGEPLGQIDVFGPMDFGRRVGRLEFRLTSVGRTALNLFGAPMGLDFGATAIEGSGFCDVSSLGRKITVNVKLGANNLSIRQGALATPPMNLQFELRGNSDANEKSAYIDRLSLNGTQAGEPLLNLQITRAINLSWRPGEQPGTSAGLVEFSLSNLRLKDWSSLLSSNILDGVVNLRADITTSRAGRQISADIASTNVVAGLAIRAGDTVVSNINADFTGTLSVSEFRIVGVDRGALAYREGTNALVHSTFSASVDTHTSSGNANVTANADLPQFLLRHPIPNLAFNRGNLRANLLLNWSSDQYAATASLIAGDVNGTVGGYQISGYSAQFDAGGELQRDKFFVRRLGLSGREGTLAGGSAEIVGELDGANQTARLTLNVSGLNHSALRPFLAPAFTAHDLTSVIIDAQGELRYDARELPPQLMDYIPRLQQLLEQMRSGAGETLLTLNAHATNLVVHSRASGKSSPPTGFRVTFDATRRGDVIDLGTNRFQLPPTPRANNDLVLSGHLDLSPTNPTPSTLTARATALDLTSLYDLMTVMESAGGTPSTPGAPSPADTAPETEPPPVSMPVRQLTADLKVDALYLHEMTVQNWITKVTVEGDQITVAPLSLSLNSAPVSGQASLDLSRAGYVYDFGLDAAGIPLEPIVNSTAPEYKGKIRGDLFSQFQIAGAGITGSNLQKNLRGHARLSCTNLNFEIVTPRTKRLLTSLATALRIDDLAQSPLTLLAADLTVTNGSVNIQPFVAASDAFYASAEGAIRLDSILSNSTINLPVQFALRSDLARQIKLANLSASPRTNYLSLPPLIRLAGTLGAPETEIDKIRLAALVAGSLGGAIGGQTGTALEGVNSLLQGNTQGAIGSLNDLLQRPKPAAATNAPPGTARPAGSTNAPPDRTNQTSGVGGQAGTAIEGVNSLLQGDTRSALGSLGNLLQRPKAAAPTNAPATNNPAKPAPAP